MYVCYEVVLYTDDACAVTSSDPFFYMTSIPINHTNRYMLFSLNTDDINYANKTLSVCMLMYISGGTLREMDTYIG